MSSNYHLRVYPERSELVRADGEVEIFLEGPTSPEARERYKKITKAFADGFVENQIETCRDNAAVLNFSNLSDEHIVLLTQLVERVNSNEGRALVGLTVLQLSIKTVEPGQSIRLHKGSNRKKTFSWKGGVSMRTLDAKYNTPILRKYDLLKVNSYGVFMTRSLAENYPFSLVYKALPKGPREQWMEIVENVEAGSLSPEQALRFLLSQLLNRASEFEKLAASALEETNKFLQAAPPAKNRLARLMLAHIDKSDYAARIMEISMHSLMQALLELGALEPETLKPLSQMRSANKKHGNIGDIEVLDDNEGIIEAWDAKYGISYLRDEIEELTDKLPSHPELSLVGFVTSIKPERLTELEARIEEIKDYYGVDLNILTLSDWIDRQYERGTEAGIADEELSQRWLLCYSESLAQKRREIAPIDEPCQHWLETLKSVISLTIS